MGSTLKQALALTRAGRLGEATALLRDALPGAASAGGAAPGGGWPAGGWSGRGVTGSPRLDTTRPNPLRPDALQPKPLQPKPLQPKPIQPKSPPAGGERPAPGRFTSHLVRCAQGERPFKLYLPRSYAGSPLPLVVMLHGCTQSPDDFAAGTAMNAVADEEGIIVAYPEQSRAANASKCWNWFRAGDQRRDGGEPAIIAAMVAEIAGMVAVDRARVFAAGLSAGGAAAAVLGQSYPDVFAAVGVHSGLACGAARDLPTALQAMQGAPMATPPGRRVPTIVFHGTADRTVNPANARAVLAQAVADLPPPRVERGRSPGGIDYERAMYGDGRRAEAWTLEGVGHAWSGGSAAGSYTDPRGPDASRAMVRFFLGRSG